MSKLRSAIRSALRHSLRIRQSETVLILTDEPLQELATTFLSESRTFASRSFLFVMPELIRAHVEPSAPVAALMADSDVILLLTSRSISHTQARRKANKAGARIASLPNVNEATLIRCLHNEQKQMIDLSKKLADILTIGRLVHLTTTAGTDLTFSISRMRGRADTGLLHEPGRFSNLPAGEGCIGPVHGSANGKIVVDGSFPQIGKISDPFEMRVRDGYVIRITGPETAKEASRILRPFGRRGRNIAELGIGTNPHAQFTGLTLEDEKMLGTVHIALGNNVSFDGKVNVPCHFDAVLLHPTLDIDGNTILKNGEVLV